MLRPRLVSTDFDGTLIGLGGGQTGCVPILATALEEAREAGARWVINTGRSLEFTLMGLDAFQAPCSPDFLVVNERHVFVRNGPQWEAMEPWNRDCDAVHEALFAQSPKLFDELRLWVSVTAGVELLPNEQRPEGIVTTDEDTMDRVAAFLDHARQWQPDFSYQRNSVYLRFSHRDYDKGAALRHLTRDLGLKPAQVLAVGDNHNDLPMLRADTAGMCACPANSIGEVRQAVESVEGYVARSYYGEGTAEGMRYFLGTLP